MDLWTDILMDTSKMGENW